MNFGLCDQFLGYGLVNGICSAISGCGTIVGNIDYAPALSSSIESCQNGCMTISDALECSNLANVDFGACAMPLGYGVIGNQCQMISGCSTISGTIDYSNSGKIETPPDNYAPDKVGQVSLEQLQQNRKM